MRAALTAIIRSSASSKAGAIAKAIQRAHFDQAFQRSPANLAQIHPPDKIVQISKRTVRPFLHDDASTGPCPHFSPRPGQSEWWHFLRCRSSMVKSHPLALISGGSTGIPIRRQSATYKATLAVSFLVDRKQGGHVFNRVMEFQIGGLNRDHAIIGGMALLKPYRANSSHSVENCLGSLFRNTICRPRH